MRRNAVRAAPGSAAGKGCLSVARKAVPPRSRPHERGTLFGDRQSVENPHGSVRMVIGAYATSFLGARGLRLFSCSG